MTGLDPGERREIHPSNRVEREIERVEGAVDGHDIYRVYIGDDVAVNFSREELRQIGFAAGLVEDTE